MTVIGLFCFLLFLLECKSEYGKFEIVGGEPIKIENAPFFAIYKLKKDVHGCGGFIVTDQFILSAAHCHFLFEDSEAEVIVGTDNINKGQHYDIKTIYQHPNFNIVSLDYDVVVLKLMKKLVFSEKVQPIKLADSSFLIENDAVFQAMGFGITKPYDPKSKSTQLLSVHVPYVNDKKCAADYKHIKMSITKQMICAGEEGKGVCLGDSGGPLVYKGVAIGIVSFGYCASKEWPGVFARVSALRDFIDNVIKETA